MPRQDNRKDRPDQDKGPQQYRPARQKRARETERRLLDSAQILFEAKGFAGTRVSDIVRASGVSTGSYYHRFADKRQLFDVMLDRFCEEKGRMIRALDYSRAQHGDLHAVLRDLALRYHDVVDANRGLYRAAQELSVGEPAIWARLAALTVDLGRQMTGQLMAFGDEILSEPKERAIQQSVQVIITLIQQIALRAGPIFPCDRAAAAELAATAAMGVMAPVRARRGDG